MPNPNTPGVQFNEVDQSFFIKGASTDIGALIGATERGPLSTPTLVSSWPEYVRNFGGFLSNPNGLLPYVAKRALDQGARFYVVREDRKVNGVHQSQLSTANAPSTSGTASPAVLTSVPGPFSLAVGDAIVVDVAAAKSTSMTPIAAAPAQVVTSAGPFALHDGDSISFRSGPATEPVQQITFHAADFANIGAATQQELANVMARDLAGTETTLTATGLQIRSDVRGTAGRLEVVGASSPGVLAALGLAVSVAVGSGNVADARHTQASEIVALLALSAFTATVDGSGRLILTSMATGPAATLQVESTGVSGTTAPKLGVPTTQAAGGTATQVPAVQFSAADPGAWGNSLSVRVQPATNDPIGSWRCDVFYKGSLVENFEELSMTPTATRYFIKLLATSKYLAVADLNAAATVPAPGNRPAPGTYTLQSGGDAIDSMVEADILGDSAHRTGLFALDPVRDVSMLATPGWTTLNVANAAIAYCENRKDVLYIGCVPFGAGGVGPSAGITPMAPNEAIQYRNATGAYSTGSKPSSSYGALYFDWIGVIDALTALERFIPVDGEVLAAMARAPRPWLAPAGIQRAKVQGITRLAYQTSDDEIGNLYAYGINSLYADPDDGPIIDGQKTLEVQPSSTDRINVRRLFIYLRKSIAPAIKFVVFEPNDDTTWRLLRRMVNPFMDTVKAGRGVYDYKFVLDETTTTANDIDNNRLVANLYLKPTKTAEYVIFNLIPTATGVKFEGP
jgi:phage tail sheath protein FI